MLNSFSTSSSPSLIEYAGTASTLMSVLRTVLMFVMGITLSRLLLLNSRCLSLPALMVTVFPRPGMLTPSIFWSSFCSSTLPEDEWREAVISPPLRLMLVPPAEAKVELDLERMYLIAGLRVGIAAEMRIVLCSKDEA